jgi:CheY-like chemotaxis protein
LLCEDNILNQKLVKSVIYNFGYEVDIAENGEAGIQLLSKNKYDLILMDLQMPVKDGYQTTQYIRNEMKLNIPIIAMTAHSLVGEQERCYKEGMNGYVPKPFKQAVLLEAIKTVMNKDIPLTQKRNIDLSFIDEVSCGDPDFKQDMISLFLEKIPNEVAQLEEALHKNDVDTAKKLSHTMKSSLDIFMLKDLSNYVSIIEKEANLGEFSTETVGKINTLRSEITEIISILKKI